MWKQVLQRVEFYSLSEIISSAEFLEMSEEVGPLDELWIGASYNCSDMYTAI